MKPDNNLLRIMLSIQSTLKDFLIIGKGDEVCKVNREWNFPDILGAFHCSVAVGRKDHAPRPHPGPKGYKMGTILKLPNKLLCSH